MRSRCSSLILAILTSCLGLTSLTSAANAQTLPRIVESPVVVDGGTQNLRDAVSDGVGGHFIAYDTYTPGRDSNVYLRRVGGRAAWAAPIRVNDRPGSNPKLARTRDGVAISWEESPTGATVVLLRLQKYSLAGVALWSPTPPEGFARMQVYQNYNWLSTGVGFVAIAKGTTGLAGSEWLYMAYRIGIDGAVASKTVLGRELRGVPGDFKTAACMNRARQTIVVLPGEQVIAHKLSAMGEQLWGKGGISVTSDFSTKSGVSVACDPTGGATIAWSDNRRSSTTFDFFAQHLDDAGRATWSDRGIELGRDAGVVPVIDIASDEAGGAYVVAIRYVSDERDTFVHHLPYGFHISAEGRVTFGAGGGLRLEPLNGNSRNVRMVSDGKGGAFASWQTFPPGGRVVDGVPVPASSRDINCIAHVWLTSDGMSSWGSEPARAGQCSSAGSNKQLVVSNGSVTSFWSDVRSGYADVYRWTFDASGVTAPALLVPPPPITPQSLPRLPPGTRPSVP